MIGMFIIFKLNGYELNFIFKSEAITAILSVAFFIVYEKSVEKALIDKKTGSNRFLMRKEIPINIFWKVKSCLMRLKQKMKGQ